MVLGGSYEIPLMHGLLDPQAMMEVLSSPSYEKDSIDREYRSVWSGSPVGAAFGAAEISDLRKVVRAETKARKEVEGSEAFYVISADMAKDGSANTAGVVWRVVPGEFAFLYTTVNIFQIDTTDYQKVSAELKRIIAAFNATMFIYDANGIGAALRDWLNKEQFDETTNQMLPAYGIINPPEKSKKDIQIVSRDRTICYEVKGSGDVAGHINKIFFSKMGSRNIRFLIKKEEALAKFSENKNFTGASHEVQKSMLRPYLFMERLEEEMKNLDIKDISDRMNPHTLIVTQRNKKVQKDIYSAASYGVYGVHTYLEVPYYSKKRKDSSSLANYIMKM